MADKVRLQFDFALEAVKDLDELREALGATSRVDVVKQALGLLQWAVKSRRDGWELLIERGDEQRVVVLPSLQQTNRGDKRTAAIGGHKQR
jgi:hypothetical protein